MAGLCVGLVTGRRELVAAAVGATVGVFASLLVGRVSGSWPVGCSARSPACWCPTEQAHERAPLGSQASAERYAMPGAPRAPFT